MRTRSIASSSPSRVLAALAIVSILGVTAACSSSGSSSSSKSASGASKSEGASAIKVMTITSIKGTGANFADVATAAKAAVKAINSSGGIKGHQIDLEICDDRGVTSETSKCAHQAVTDKVAAVIGSISFNAAQYMPVLEAAKIPYLAGTALSAEDFTSEDSYPVVAGPVGFAGLGAETVTDGCKSVGVVEIGIPAAATGVTFFQLGRASQGASPAKVTVVPATTSDYSATASAVKNDDCVAAVLPDPFLTPFLAAAKQQGISPKIYAPAGAITQADVNASGSQLEGAVSVSDFVSLENPAWSAYKTAMAGSDTTSLITQNTWVAFQIFASVANQATAYDGASIQSALNAASAVSTGGLAPTINFMKEFPVPHLNRIFNSQVTYLVFKSGFPVALKAGFVDAAAFLSPKK